MNNESYWQKTTTLPHYPKIKQDCTYDIVIVGGGMSGITLAYRLNNSNFNVALLESDTLASKTTGHTTGKVTCLHDVICVDICKAYGNDKAKEYFDSNNESLNEIKEINNICNVGSCSGYLIIIFNTNRTEQMLPYPAFMQRAGCSVSRPCIWSFYGILHSTDQKSTRNRKPACVPWKYGWGICQCYDF